MTAQQQLGSVRPGRGSGHDHLHHPCGPTSDLRLLTTRRSAPGAQSSQRRPLRGLRLPVIGNPGLVIGFVGILS